jgi:hypothetical protein
MQFTLPHSTSFRSTFVLAFCLCLGITVVSFIQKCFLTITVSVIICMCVYPRHSDIVEAFIIALFSVTDFTVVKYSALRKCRQCNGLRVQNFS